VKLLRGGLVDAEFIAHALQLRERAGVRPDMAGALAELAAAGLITGDVPGAFDLLSRVLVAARLLAPDGILPESAPCASLAKTCGFGDWKEMITAMEAARAAIARQWTATFGQQLEMQA